jgi:hypothetical protein
LQAANTDGPVLVFSGAGTHRIDGRLYKQRKKPSSGSAPASSQLGDQTLADCDLLKKFQ